MVLRKEMRKEMQWKSGDSNDVQELAKMMDKETL